jgi:myosin-crossreactive antigen
MEHQNRGINYRPYRAQNSVFLIGGGIASLSAAAFLIRDGIIPGHNITNLEDLDRLGGSLDGAGSPQQGYVLRGGRMIESKYRSTSGQAGSCLWNPEAGTAHFKGEVEEIDCRRQ